MALSVENNSSHHFEIRYATKTIIVAPGQKFDLEPGQVELYWKNNYVGNCSGFSWDLNMVDSGPVGTEYSVNGNSLTISDDDEEVSSGSSSSSGE